MSDDETPISLKWAPTPTYLCDQATLATLPRPDSRCIQEAINDHTITYYSYLQESLRSKTAKPALRLSNLTIGAKKVTKPDTTGRTILKLTSTCQAVDEVLGTKPFCTEWKYTPAGPQSELEVVSVDSISRDPWKRREGLSVAEAAEATAFLEDLKEKVKAAIVADASKPSAN